jgi:hypothetical protein
MSLSIKILQIINQCLKIEFVPRIKFNFKTIVGKCMFILINTNHVTLSM